MDQQDPPPEECDNTDRLVEALLRNFCIELPPNERKFYLGFNIEESELIGRTYSQITAQPSKSTVHSAEILPSTSAEIDQTADYKPIEILIGCDNDVDQQASTSSSFVNFAHPAESTQDAKIYARIQELREAGLWRATQLPKCEDPPRKKTHWDFFLEEVRWMATDFANERKTKKFTARRLALFAKAEWRRIYDSNQEVKKQINEEKEARRVCGTISKMIRDFWANVDKVVDFRATEIVESKKRKALGQQLNFLVGAAESILHEHMAEPSTVSRKSDRQSSRMDYDVHSEFGGGMTDEDDEATLEREEAFQQKAHIDLEVNELSKEANMDLDDILTSLPEGYLETLGYKIPLKIAENENDVTESSRIESVDEQMMSQSTSEHITAMPDLKNVNYSELNSESEQIRRKQLDNIAEAALEFQPRGYTLETTEVKTEVPFLLCGTLREYQLVGLDWLVTLYEKNLNGILADEMGLGKTIQTIALLAHLACDRAVWGPHLIIVPTSVILNWEMELKKWCPSLKVLSYFGTAKERAEKRKGWSKNNAFHVCITSYKLATQDVRAFKKKAWQYLILDEAQNIKNFKSQRWQILLGLRSRRRLLLTGTPLQNSLMELWALLHFLMPHVFTSHDDFKEWFHSPITGMVEGTTEVDQALVQQLHKILRPFILRRLKCEVEKQLPTKKEQVITCFLSKRQRFLYNEFLSRRSTVENLQSGNMLSVLGIIIQLRKCCNHPNLFEPRPVLSPLIMHPIRLRFPLLPFPTKAQLESSKPAHLLALNGKSSLSTWEFFKQISARTHLPPITQKTTEEVLPFIDKSIKFVSDSDGGHFYRAINDQTTPENEITVCNGDLNNSQHITAEFVNKTRKRRFPSEQPTQNLQSSSHIEYGDNFNSAREELQESLENRMEQCRNIGIWLSRMKRQKCEPLLSTEAEKFVILNEIERKYFPSLLQHQNRIKNSNDELQHQLFEQVCDRIQQRLVDWIELSLNRFLICVQKVVLNGSFVPPLITAYDKYENELCQRRAMICCSEENYLAQKAHQLMQMEFPERRLIEYDCGKLQVLSRLLERLFENKHRCLIFTQMSKMLDILQAFLSYHNYKYFRLDGATHIDQRQAMMERFNADESIFCFILSTRSGGIGVNLTGADTVIFYDSDWNPTMDAQAQDRCHRIGQTRNVTIYRLISERTIEENILAKSMQKRRLGEMAIDEGEFTPDFFKNTANLRDLFSNEAIVSDVIAPVVYKPENLKDVEEAMHRVEDKQDAMAAQVAETEFRAEAAEFDENLNVASTSYELRDIDSPSEQYLELISGLKPVERYAVNFLANEYRPTLDKEVEEAEAKIRAKQREFLEQQQRKCASSSSDEEKDEKTKKKKQPTDEEQLEFAYDAVSPLDEFFGSLTPAFSFDVSSFDDIRSWMPPSPPNSEAGHPIELYSYSPIDGALLYQPMPMKEDQLPPLLPSLDTLPSRMLLVNRSPRKQLPGAHSLNHRSEQHRQHQHPPHRHHHRASSERTQKGAVVPNGQMSREVPDVVVGDKELLQYQVKKSVDPGLLSPPESAPNTPMTQLHHTEVVPLSTVVAATHPVPVAPVAVGPPAKIVVLSSATTSPAPTVQLQQPMLLEGTSQATSTPPAGRSSLDESIESTLRKSCKRVQSPSCSTAPRYLIRNSTGPVPQQSVERVSSEDPSRLCYRLVCPDWRTNYAALPMPSAGAEPLDFEGPRWNAAEDQRLLKAVSSKHSLGTELLVAANPGLQFNWEFVAQYVNIGSFHYRSPRQCAMRYQNFVLRCDETFEEAGRKGSSSAARRSRQPAPGPPPHSVIFDSNLGFQEAASALKRRAAQMAECAQQRRRAASAAVPERTEPHQSQLLCLAGRMPQQQEARLAELGARYTNVMRPTDILDMRKQILERRALQQQQMTTVFSQQSSSSSSSQRQSYGGMSSSSSFQQH